MKHNNKYIYPKTVRETIEGKRHYNINEKEMLKTFNCGIGMVLSVDSERAEAIESKLSQYEMQPTRLGHVITGEGVQYEGELQF